MQGKKFFRLLFELYKYNEAKLNYLNLSNISLYSAAAQVGNASCRYMDGCM